MIRRRLPLAISLLACSVITVEAQSPREQTPAPTLPPRVGVEPGAPLSLTLSEAIRLTLEQNNDVAVARLQTEGAEQEVRAQEGVFDPRFIPSFLYQRAALPVASAIGGATNGRVEQNQLAGGLLFGGRSPWAGGRFGFEFVSTRVETNNQFARLNPEFPSALGVTFTQPLLRGRTIDLERRQILLARRAADLTDAQLTQIVMDQLTLVEQAYWDLVFATRNLEVQAAALQQAQGQVASNERQVGAGTLAPIDVVEAATQVANFRQSVASAQQAVTEAENRLKNLMLSTRQASAWNQPVVPADLIDRPLPTFSLEQAMPLALARRPELAALDTVRAQNDIDRRFFQDESRPQLDLVGSYTLSGLAGTPLGSIGNPLESGTDAALLARLNDLSVRAGLSPLDPPAPTTGSTMPPFFVGSYGASLRNILARRFPTAVVQLQIELPLANRTAKANVARTRITADQIQRQRQRLEQTIESDVRNAMQTVQTSQERLEAAGTARRNALEQYESERRRFESGISTVFLVLERQTALVTAQAQELRVRADLNQAIALLDRAVGTTLERHGVQLERS